MPRLESSYNTQSFNSYAPSSFSKAKDGFVNGKNISPKLNTLQMNDYKAFKFVKEI